MNMTKTMLALVGAALMTAGAFADEPTITLTSFQQRYPWNGLVDIDYTVANVANPDDYYVKFTVTTNGAATGIVATDFLDAEMLAKASNGTYRVTWDTEHERAFIFSKDVTVRADLVFDPGCKGERSPYVRYLEIDLTGDDVYQVETEFIGTRVGCLKYNTDEYKTNKLVLRRIKAGTFVMGSPIDEVGRVSPDGESYYGQETQHGVTLTKNYYIGVFPVTQTQWNRVMGSNPSRLKPSDAAICPVDYVNYSMIRGTSDGVDLAKLTTGEVDANSFLGILRDKTGLNGLDLPTEAQWERACRAETTGSTYFGNNVTTDQALWDPYIWTTPNTSGITHGVGQKVPNPWGLYDLLGNAYEICRDRVTNPGHNLGSDAVTDPLNANGGYAPMRGGDSMDGVRRSRSAVRSTFLGVQSKPLNTICSLRLSMTLP